MLHLSVRFQFYPLPVVCLLTTGDTVFSPVGATQAKAAGEAGRIPGLWPKDLDDGLPGPQSKGVRVSAGAPLPSPHAFRKVHPRAFVMTLCVEASTLP